MRPHDTRKVRKLLKARGREVVGTEGSHEKWRTPGGLTNTLKAAERQQSPGLLRTVQEVFEAEFGDKWLEKALEPERFRKGDR